KVRINYNIDLTHSTNAEHAFIGTKDALDYKDCRSKCCDDANCNIAVYNKAKDRCFLIRCFPLENCKFRQMSGYTSGLLNRDFVGNTDDNKDNNIREDTIADTTTTTIRTTTTTTLMSTTAEITTTT
ncbi:unnamed protein product, partial [Owenia fusiformis]